MRGERALDDIDLDGRAVRSGLDSCFAMCMAAGSVCSLIAALTALYQVSPRASAVVMTRGQLMVQEGVMLRFAKIPRSGDNGFYPGLHKNSSCQLRQAIIGSIDSSCWGLG